MALAFTTQAESLAPDYAQHANFQTQWGLASINANLAYAHVNLLKGAGTAPGAGVTIGFMDTGIDDQHPVFAGKTIAEQLLSGAPQETGDRFSHGTAVASIAAGGRIGGSDAAHGVAWGADIAMFAIPAGTGNNVYNPISLASLLASDSGWAAGWTPCSKNDPAGRSRELLWSSRRTPTRRCLLRRPMLCRAAGGVRRLLLMCSRRCSTIESCRTGSSRPCACSGGTTTCG